MHHAEYVFVVVVFNGFTSFAASLCTSSCHCDGDSKTRILLLSYFNHSSR